MLKALLIEDDRDTADGLKRYLHGAGEEISFLRFGQIDVAYSCDEAIRLAGGGTEYDVIVYDLQLPWSKEGRPEIENGRRLIQEIAPLQRAACGIVFSDFTDNDAALEMEQIGVVRRLVRKPAGLDKVLQASEEAILEAARMTFEQLEAGYHLQAGVHEAMNSLNNILAAASEIARLCSPMGEFIPARSLPLIRGEVDNIRRFEQGAETALRTLQPAATVERKACDLRQIAEWCLTYLQHQYPKQQDRIGLRVEGDLPSTLGVRAEMEQLILLIARNALQTTERKGRVTISLAFSKGDGEFVLAIEDDGPGIPPADRKRLFERGFTTRPGGSGQGLFLARAFVWNHGGRIEVESGEGRGTRVTVRLPVREVPTDA